MIDAEIPTSNNTMLATVSASARILPITGPCQIALSRADVMTELGISLSTVERLINRGDLPAFKVGAQWRIHRKDLDAYIDASRAEQRKRTGAHVE